MHNVKVYAGIGSRNTPQDVLVDMKRLAEELALMRWTLRSGAAEGADTAFEEGSDLALGKKEIYLPWPKFNGHTTGIVCDDPRAFDMARQFHPAYSNLSRSVRKLMARNSHQIFGKNMDEPVQFVVCWTEGGLRKGGTGQALRIAEAHGIVIYDLAIDSPENVLKHAINWTS